MTKLDESKVVTPVTTGDSYSEVVHTTKHGDDEWQIRKPKHTGGMQAKHAIFKNGKYHSVYGAGWSAKANLDNILKNNVKEETEMTAQNLLTAIVENDEASIKSIFESVLRDKVMSALEEKRIEIAQTMFNAQTSDDNLEENITRHTFVVKHDGHKDIDFMPPGKTVINHVTRYEDSAWKTYKMLKEKGFINPRIERNGKPFPGNE